MDLYEVENFVKGSDPVHCYAKHAESYIKKLREGGDDRFFIIVHFRFAPHGFVTIYAMPKDRKQWPELFKTFADKKTSDAERNKRFKIIPNVNDGPWVVRNAVGSQPAILGKKLKTEYIVTDDYIEISVDVYSSRI